MAEPFISKNSFKFGNVDMYDRFGIQLRDNGYAADLLLPSIRERKVINPQRHGAYDFGAKYYNERPLVLKCVTLRPLVKIHVREYIREISYVLSKKDEIRIGQEPGKYYIGRVADQAQLDQIRGSASEFDLTFLCEPFAYGQTYTENFTGLRYESNYRGTAATPTRIEITNSGTRNAVGITITQINKRENY